MTPRPRSRSWRVVAAAIGLATLVIVLVYVQAVRAPELWIPVLVEALPAYFVFMGIAVGAAQLPRAAARLPGERRFYNRYGTEYPPPEK